MTCKACGAHLAIEDELCPYCGTPNPSAIRHRRDMRTFSREFVKTRSSVLDAAGKSARKSTRIILLCVMIVLCLLSIAFSASAWSLSYTIQEWQAASDYDTYSAMLDEYEKNDNFLALAALYDQKNLYGADKYDQYRYIYNASSRYSYIFSYVGQLREKERWEGDRKDTMKYLCDYIDSYYEQLERAAEDISYGYNDSGEYEPVHLAAVDRVTAKMEALLRLAFAMTGEEAEAFRNYSSAEKRVFLERRFAELEPDI